MDIIDILGGMLNRKASGSGKGPDIFNDILKGRKRPPPDKRAGSPPASPSDDALGSAARELEDLLNVAHNRDAARRTGQPLPPQQPQQPRQPPQRVPADAGVPVDSPYSSPRDERSSSPRSGRLPQNEQALVLVRAMVNAAKADGRISTDEQQNILQHIGGEQADAIQFFRDEMAQPLDVREFAWSVPLGMEHQVYAMSLMAIDADSRAETQYLNDLAHGLRLPAEARDQLHRRYAPRLVQ